MPKRDEGPIAGKPERTWITIDRVYLNPVRGSTRRLEVWTPEPGQHERLMSALEKLIQERWKSKDYKFRPIRLRKPVPRPRAKR